MNDFLRKNTEVFAEYWDFLRTENEKMNLTAITNEGEAYAKHFLDSLAPLCLVELAQLFHVEQLRLIDVGSGAGFPGIPLKIARPDMELTLLDPLQKRIKFLSALATRLALERTYLIHGRAEELAHTASGRDNYDIAISRAVARLKILAELCLPLVRVGGYFLAMKGMDIQEEEKEAKAIIATLGGKLDARAVYEIPSTIALPETSIQRQIFVIEKIHATPEGYPRKWKKISA